MEQFWYLMELRKINEELKIPIVLDQEFAKHETSVIPIASGEHTVELFSNYDKVSGEIYEPKLTYRE